MGTSCGQLMFSYNHAHIVYHIVFEIKLKTPYGGGTFKVTNPESMFKTHSSSVFINTI